jgi:signal transduction histidine kinase
LETTVTHRTARLREMLDELHHVSYAMVHDMRAPLRAMRVYADLLADTERELDPSGTHDYLRRIAAAAARLDTLITDALKYTRVLHEQLPMEPVDLEGLIRGLIESYPNLRPESVEICIEAPLPVVLGNESLLTQCFSNLLGNAAKFVEPGTRPQIRVRAERVQAPQTAAALPHPPDGGSRAASSPTLSLAASGREKPAATQYSTRDHQPPSLPFVRIWVEDNGIGIPGGSRHRLFGIFERFNHQYEGTGIGLAIVRKVTERMGGSVGVESEEGKGSRFWVQLRSAGH